MLVVRTVIKGRAPGISPRKFWIRSPATLIEKQHINHISIAGFPGYFLHIPAYLKNSDSYVRSLKERHDTVQDNRYLAGWWPSNEVQRSLSVTGRLQMTLSLLQYHTLLFSQNSSEHLKIKKGRLKVLIPFQSEMPALFDAFPLQDCQKIKKTIKKIVSKGCQRLSPLPV